MDHKTIENIADNIVTLAERPETHNYGFYCEPFHIYQLASDKAVLTYYVKPKMVAIVSEDPYYESWKVSWDESYPNEEWQNFKESLDKYFPEAGQVPMIHPKFKTVMDRLIKLCDEQPENLPYYVREVNKDYECFNEKQNIGIILNFSRLDPGIFYYKKLGNDLSQFFLNEWNDPEDYNIFIAMLEEDFPEVLHDLLTDEERKQAMEYLETEYPEYYEGEID